MQTTVSEVKQQTISAYTQHAEKWRENATAHRNIKQKSMEDFRNIGIGRAVLCVANGYSFEQNLDVIKANKDKVDIICCDKTLGHLLDAGIQPTYCLVADAKVDHSKYLMPWKDKVKDTILLMNVCANPEWSFGMKWKDRYFFVNEDAMHYEREFMELSGCQNVIPAGTNVSNAMVIILTQCRNEKRVNFFGYDKIILIGFDYSWTYEGKYYAFCKDGNGKANYMRHIYTFTTDGKPCYTSHNLFFSAKWFTHYLSAFNLPVVNCSDDTLVRQGKKLDLAEQMNYCYHPEDANTVIGMNEELTLINERAAMLRNKLKHLGEKHYYGFRATV